jgi:hypothetical protein
MAINPGKFGVLFVRVNGEPPVWGPVIQQLHETISDQVFEVESMSLASAQIQGGWIGVVYLVLLGKDDLVPIINFLLRHQREIKTAKTVRVSVFSVLTNSQVSDFLQKSGATEVLDFDTSQKAIAHKISTQLKLIEKAAQGGEKKGIEFDKSFKAKPNDELSDLQHVTEKHVQPTPLRTKSSSLPEEAEPSWQTGTKAMEKQGAFPKWEGNAIEIVDQPSERSLMISVPKKDWKVGQKFALDFETLNLKMAPLLKMNGTIESLQASELDDRAMISIQLDPESAKLYAEVQDKLDELQEGIHQFLKEAKG